MQRRYAPVKVRRAWRRLACIGFQALSVSSYRLYFRRIIAPQASMLRLPILAFTCALLAACTSPAPAPQSQTVDEGDVPPEGVAERPIPTDSLYPLLLAEFALRQQAYDLALEQYVEQSRLLRDPGLSAHTTHLSQFLQQDETALQSAQLWVELNPDNIEANHTLAEMLVRRGRNVEALPLLAVVERQGGGANFPVLVSGYTQLGSDQRVALEEGVAELSTEFPDNPRLLLTSALIHAENQQFDSALDDLDDLFRAEPEQQQALLLEARILVEQEAKNPYTRLEKVLRNNPEEKMLRLQYAGLLTATDMTAAREQFEILSTQAPRDGNLLFSLALINREMGNAETASDYLLQSIALGQRTNEAYFYLGRIAEENGEQAQAIVYYGEVHEGEEFLAATTRAGQMMINDGDLESSGVWFSKQRAFHPHYQGQLYGLEADTLAHAGHLGEAIALLDEALEKQPDSMGLLYSRAMLYEQEDNLAGMERDLRAILATDPHNATALNALGYTLADRTTRYDEALQLISRALELQPDEPAILDSMGWIMFRTGQYEESLKYLNRAYREFPDPEVAAHLGEVLWAQGDTEAAREIWLEALQQDPDHPTLISTLQRLGVDAPDLAPAPEPEVP